MSVFYLVVVVLFSLPILRVCGTGSRVLVLAGVAVVCAASYWLRPQHQAEPSASHQLKMIPTQAAGRGFVTSNTCRKCHPGEFSTWHDTFHRTMTQVVSPKTVLAPFDDKPLKFHGRDFRFYRKGDEFWVRLPDPDPRQSTNLENASSTDAPEVDRRVVLSTGSHHVQIYWVSAGDHLREVPIYYHIDGKRWVPKNDSTLMPPDPRMFSQVWNIKCIRCHSVGGIPNADIERGTVKSVVAEFGISCEACHGPAREHVQHHSNPLNRYRQHLGDKPDPTIVNPAKVSPTVSSQICGQCHTEFDPRDLPDFYDNGLRYRAGKDLDKSHRMFRFDEIRNERNNNAAFYRESAYWADGTCRAGGDEYLGMIESPCYKNAKESKRITCLSCHAMHNSDPNDQLKHTIDRDRDCLQCHSKFRERIAEHTHHPAGSTGSRCANCHMPNTSFALFTAMRSHRISVPSAAASAKSGRPNACNLCHLDKTLAWTAERMTKWYDSPPADLTKQQREVPATILWALRGDAAQRVVSVWHMGWSPALKASGRGWQAPFIAPLLNDPYSVVRDVARSSLKRQPEFEAFKFDFIGPAEHRSKAVERALTAWRRKRRRLPKSDGLRRFFRPDGSLKREEINRLLKMRDDRKIILPE